MKNSKFKKIVILTGAGISAESGIPTFRDNDGLWENYRIEDVATPEAFAVNPTLVHEFYNKRRQRLLSGVVQPNAAHLALAKLEKEYMGDVCIVTQNIDHLHEQAGSKSVIHMHGELLKIVCNHCGHKEYCERNIFVDEVCPKCFKKGSLRPYVVWFGEVPLEMDRIQSAIMDADLFVAIGTSGVVYPAAGFVVIAKSLEIETVEINLEKTELSGSYNRSILGKASVEVPLLVSELLR